LPSSSKDHELATSKLLDREDCDKGREPVFRAIAGSEETREEGREANVVLKDGGSVVRDDINSGDLSRLESESMVSCCSRKAYLLEHLNDKCKCCAMKIPIAMHSEAIDKCP